MNIKYADKIAREIEERGPIKSDCYTTGEKQEKWFRKNYVYEKGTTAKWKKENYP